MRIIFGGGGLAAGLWLAVVAGADAQAALEGVIGIPWLSAILGRVLLVVCVPVSPCSPAGASSTP